MARDLLDGKGSMEDLPARDFLPCRAADALLLGVPARISLFSDGNHTGGPFAKPMKAYEFLKMAAAKPHKLNMQ